MYMYYVSDGTWESWWTTEKFQAETTASQLLFLHFSQEENDLTKEEKKAHSQNDRQGMKESGQ